MLVKPQQSEKPKRYVNQPEHYGWEDLNTNMKSFWSDFSKLAYEQTGRYPNFTSGKRSADQKIGKNYKTSVHNEGNAIDMSSDYAMYNVLVNTPKGLELLNQYGLGVLDETTKAAMDKTGATGAHYHIGADPVLVEKSKNRYNNYLQTGNINILGLDRDISDTEFQIYAPAARQLEEDLEIEIQKEIEKEKKESESEARKTVRDTITSFYDDIKLAQEQEQGKYQAFQETPETKIQDILSDYSRISSFAQTKLPELPNIFKEITTKDLDKFQGGGKKIYKPSMDTQQSFISWSTLQKDYPELYQRIINADNGGYRSFKETFVDKLANQPYKKTKLGKDFKIEESGCLECDWMHNTFYERDADGNYYEITEPKEFEAPLDYYEKWQYGTRNFLENHYSDDYQYKYNITTQPQELTKQATKSYYEQLPDGTYVKRTYTDVGKTDTFEFQDGGKKKSSDLSTYQVPTEEFIQEFGAVELNIPTNTIVVNSEEDYNKYLKAREIAKQRNAEYNELYGPGGPAESDAEYYGSVIGDDIMRLKVMQTKTSPKLPYSEVKKSDKKLGLIPTGEFAHNSDFLGLLKYKVLTPIRQEDINRQILLKKLNYDKGEIDGIWDDTSEEAWQNYLRDSALRLPVKRTERLESDLPNKLVTKSEPRLNLNREYNPYTQKYEVMSPRQKRMLDRAKYLGKEAPEFTPELYDNTTMKPLKSHEVWAYKMKTDPNFRDSFNFMLSN